MIEIDGSYGSGGGQILRTAVGLSAYTLKPIRIYNIRTKRPNPGLREQHLQAILAVSKLCDGVLNGACIGSTEITFFPKEVSKNKIRIDISTAGSIGLVLQAISIPALRLKNLEIEIHGGATYGEWAPPIDYIQNVLVPILSIHGFLMNIKVERHGFYPRGGAVVSVTFRNTMQKPINLVEKTEVASIKGVSVSSNNLKTQKVAERMKESAERLIYSHFKLVPSINVEYHNTVCPGCGIVLWASMKNSIIGGSAIGKLGKKAEDVGKEAAENLIDEHKSGGVVDSHFADQILPFLAIFGGKVLASKITEHCLTNAYIVEKFLPVKIKFINSLITVES